MHPRYWSWFHQRCKNFEGNRRPLYPLYTWSYCISLWYARCRAHGKTGKQSHRGPKGSKSITTSRPLDSQNVTNGIVAVNESCIFHCPHCMALRLPRTSFVMVRRGLADARGVIIVTTIRIIRQKWCGHWTQISEQSRRHGPRPAEIDSQQLQQTWCEHNFFLTSSYQMQPAPSPTKWIGKQTNTSSTEQHCNSKLRTQMTPTKESGGRKFSSSSYVDVNEVRTNKQNSIELALCKAMGWGTRRPWLSTRNSLQIQTQNLNVFSV